MSSYILCPGSELAASIMSGLQQAISGKVVGIVLVALRYDGWWVWPLDGEGWVIPSDALARFREIEFRHLIKDLGVVLKRHKSVGQSLGHIKHIAIFR